MKRQTFRLASVLRYYALQKQRAELELHEGGRLLREADGAVASLTAQLCAVSALLQDGAPALSTTGWIACYRKAEWLDQELSAARTRRDRQAEFVARLEEHRKRWAVAEETLLSLRRKVDENNDTEDAKAQQVSLDEIVLRQWLPAVADHTEAELGVESEVIRHAADA
jgi:hypothetical protein